MPAHRSTGALAFFVSAGVKLKWPLGRCSAAPSPHHSGAQLLELLICCLLGQTPGADSSAQFNAAPDQRVDVGLALRPAGKLIVRGEPFSVFSLAAAGAH